MSILIRGMEMPQGNSTINVLIYADGTVYTGHVNDSRYSAVSVPTPHGRLIDADALLSNDEIVQILTSNPQRTGKLIKEFAEMFVDKVNRHPTIIGAEGSET